MIDLFNLLTRKVYNHETELQRDYLSTIEHQLNLEFVNKFNTDGYTINGPVRFLCEFKRANKGWNLSNKEHLSRCLIQALVYICVLEKEEGFIPEYIFIATERKYCFFESKEISKFRNVLINETDASSAWKRHPDLIKILKNITINVLDVKKDIQDIILSLFHVNKGTHVSIKIEKVEIVKKLFFDFESRNIITDSLTTHEMANIFIGILIGIFKPLEGDNLLSTTIKRKPQVTIDREKYDNFISLSEKVTDPELINEIVSNKSELIDQLTRRYEGEFFTPQDLVDLGNNYIRNYFGSHWRDRNVIHEPTWGLGQLTRGRKFKYLFCSTLNQEDIDFAEKLQYNLESIDKFQYDWLKDDCNIATLKYSRKLPISYLKLVKKLPLIILSNFPYGSSGTGKKDGTGKDNICSKTEIHKIMKKDKISFDKAMSNLYTQCLYRCLLHKRMLKKDDFYIACYCPFHFLTGPGFKNFRKEFFSEFTLESGFIIPAKVFKSLKSDFPILFAIFSSRKSSENKEILLDEYDEELRFKKSFQVEPVVKPLKEWIESKDIYFAQKRKVPIMSSYKTVGKRYRKEYIDKPEKWPIDVFSLLVFDSNNIETSRNSVYIINTDIRSGLGKIKINNLNFYKCMAAFTARKSAANLLYSTKNAKKEFSFPDENYPLFENFVFDSVIYSLFNSSSHQASLEGIISCGDVWDIENELFWMSRNSIINLSRKFGNVEIYKHAKRSGERFVYKEINKFKDKLSNDAKELLNYSEILVRDSFHKRDDLMKKDKKLNINRWDAGWKQIKELLNFCEINIDDFNSLYYKFEQRLLDEILKIGFLK